jgi:hypothetical protein
MRDRTDISRDRLAHTTKLSPPMTILRRYHTRSGSWLVILAVAGLPWGFQRADAQQGLPAPPDLQSPFQGVVLEESSFQPIESARVAIVGTNLVAETDAYGSFAFPDPPMGRISVRITAPDQVSTVQEVELREGGILHVQILLPRITAVLAELLVVGGAVEASSGAPSTAADLVARQVPGLLFPASSVGDAERGIRLRGANTFAAAADPHLFIDGVRVVGSQSIYEALTRIPAAEVDRIEVLRGPAAAFLHQYGANGVIHVYTNR